MYQKLTLVGRLGSDPEMRYMADGTAVTNFSVATNRRWLNRTGEQAEETTWFRVSVWGSQAEACHTYLTRGRKVLIEGALTPDMTTGAPRLWTRRDGSVGASFEVRANVVQFLDSANGSSEMGDDGQPVYSSNGSEAVDDDIPF